LRIFRSVVAIMAFLLAFAYSISAPSGSRCQGCTSQQQEKAAR
jgi:hypothetical protein